MAKIGKIKIKGKPKPTAIGSGGILNKKVGLSIKSKKIFVLVEKIYYICD